MRRVQESAALGSYAKIMERVNEIESRKTEASRQKDEAMNQAAREITMMTDIEVMKLYNRYLDRLDAEYRSAESDFAKIRDDYEREQKKLIEARKNRRIVEILKERRREEFGKEFAKSERKQYEELNQLLKRKKGPPPAALPSARAVPDEGESYELDEKSARGGGEDAISEYLEKFGIKYPWKRER